MIEIAVWILCIIFISPSGEITCHCETKPTKPVITRPAPPSRMRELTK